MGRGEIVRGRKNGAIRVVFGRHNALPTGFSEKERLFQMI
jgi:hypothetical protein